MNAVYVLLGWLLGLLSPHLIDLIQKPYRRVLIKNSLFIELLELRPKLAALVYLFTSQTGDLNRTSIQWIQKMMGDKKRSNSEMTIAEGLSLYLDFTDEQIEMASQLRANPRRNLTLHKESLPFLASQVMSLSLFSPEFQRLALTIQANLAVFNQDIDFISFHFQKTFDSSLSTRNHEALQINMETARSSITQTARQICDQITELVALDR